MVGLADEGTAFKAKETLRVFATRRPSIATLLDNRTQEFDRIHAILPSTATTGEELVLTLQAWDQCERLIPGFEERVHLETPDDAATLPETVRFPPENDGLATLSGVQFETPGTHYLTVTHEPTGERFVSNPVRVTPGEPDSNLYWGDLHLHSTLSDGSGMLVDGFRFGRDVMQLDVVAYADHDTMGFFIPPSLQRRRMHARYFDRLKDVVAAFHEPDEFVTLLAYEWTKQPNVGGHINVYFDGVEGGELFDSHAPQSDTYEKLFARLREFNDDEDGTDGDDGPDDEEGADDDHTRALAIPHHPAEATFPFDFSSMDYDDEVAPLVEVYSQWGSSERPESEGNRYPVAMGQGEAEEPGHYVQDALELGNRVGLMASADFHGPRPGHSIIHTEPHLPGADEWTRSGLGWGNIWRIWEEPSYPGGLTGFWAPELSREAIFESLRTRRVFGTTQPHRTILDFRVDGVRVGEADSEVVLPEPTAERRIELDVAGTAPLAEVTVVKNNEPWHREAVSDDPDAGLDSYRLAETWLDDDPVRGMHWDDERGTDADVYYARIRQADGGMAWAGPLWVAVAD